MSETLEWRDELWAVYVNTEDGCRVKSVVFTCKEDARQHCASISPRWEPTVVQTGLWFDPATGEYFEVRRTRVLVDQPVLKRRALEKLSGAEKRALGITE